MPLPEKLGNAQSTIHAVLQLCINRAATTIRLRSDRRPGLIPTRAPGYSDMVSSATAGPSPKGPCNGVCIHNSIDPRSFVPVNVLIVAA